MLHKLPSIHISVEVCVRRPHDWNTSATFCTVLELPTLTLKTLKLSTVTDALLTEALAQHRIKCAKVDKEQAEEEAAEAAQAAADAQIPVDLLVNLSDQVADETLPDPPA